MIGAPVQANHDLTGPRVLGRIIDSFLGNPVQSDFNGRIETDVQEFRAEKYVYTSLLTLTFG